MIIYILKILKMEFIYNDIQIFWSLKTDQILFLSLDGERNIVLIFQEIRKEQVDHMSIKMLTKSLSELLVK